jgi:hypothetical protein
LLVSASTVSTATKATTEAEEICELHYWVCLGWAWPDSLAWATDYPISTVGFVSFGMNEEARGEVEFVSLWVIDVSSPFHTCS